MISTVRNRKITNFFLSLFEFFSFQEEILNFQVRFLVVMVASVEVGVMEVDGEEDGDDADLVMEADGAVATGKEI